MSYIRQFPSIATGSVTNAATANISFNGANALYKTITVSVWGIQPLTNNVSLLLRVSADGSTFDSAANSYTWGCGFSNSGATTSDVGGSTGDTSIQLGNVLASTSTVQTSVDIEIANPGGSALNPTIRFDLVAAPNGGGVARLFGAGIRLAQQQTKAIQLLMSSGNITCSWSVYGYN